MEDRTDLPPRKKPSTNTKITVSMAERKDARGNTYYFAAPDLPADVRLSDCSIFVYPRTNGEMGAALIIQVALPGKGGIEILERRLAEEEATVDPIRVSTTRPVNHFEAEK